MDSAVNRLSRRPRSFRPQIRGALLVLGFLLAASAAHACIFTYTLVGPDGNVRVEPDAPVAITAGLTYRIDVTMREDHGACSLEADDTIILLNEGRWRVNRDTQPLVLLSEIVWERVGPTRYTTSFEFDARESGDWRIDLIRECTRGGRHETLYLQVL